MRLQRGQAINYLHMCITIWVSTVGNQRSSSLEKVVSLITSAEVEIVNIWCRSCSKIILFHIKLVAVIRIFFILTLTRTVQTYVAEKTYFENYTVSLPVVTEVVFEMFTSFDTWIINQIGGILETQDSKLASYNHKHLVLLLAVRR